jgi:hypothetical protein
LGTADAEEGYMSAFDASAVPGSLPRTKATPPVFENNSAEQIESEPTRGLSILVAPATARKDIRIF